MGWFNKQEKKDLRIELRLRILEEPPLYKVGDKVDVSKTITWVTGCGGCERSDEHLVFKGVVVKVEEMKIDGNWIKSRVYWIWDGKETKLARDWELR